MKNIFISSTFRDMQAERDLVQERVLPALREEARKYGDNVGVIDLRWGVDTSTLETDEGSAKVLKVCLDEIDRSHPYMLIFLGERYGWIPNGSLIERAVRERGDKYETDDFEKSVTALEIEYGALSERYGDLSRCIVCFREPVSAELDAESEAIYAEKNEKGRQKLEELKSRIRKELGDGNRLISYACKWDEDSHSLKDFTVDGESLEKILTEKYIEMFQEDWKEYENLSWQEKEQLVFRALMESKLRTFVGRENLLEEYYQKITNATQPIVLQGEVGSGKTAIMSKLINRMQQEGKKVFPFFCGMGNMSTKAELMVDQILYFLETQVGTEGEESESLSYEKKLERVQELTRQLKEKIYFYIDALDQLLKDEYVENMNFLFHGEKVQMIVSCTDSFEIPSSVNLRTERVCIPMLSIEDAKQVSMGILRADSRDYFAEVEKELLKKENIGSPLYISLLLQRLNMMDREELSQMQTAEEIADYGANIIYQMPDDLSKAAVTILMNAITKICGKEDALLVEAVNFIAVSRIGLSLTDLKGIFQKRKLELPMLDMTLLMKYLDTFFYIGEEDRINFTHKVIRQGILDKIENRKAYEEEIKEYISQLDIEEMFAQREGMYYARITNDRALGISFFYHARENMWEILQKAIVEEAVSDEGKFYVQLIEENSKVSDVVREYVQYQVILKLPLLKRETYTKLMLLEAIIKRNEANYDAEPSFYHLTELSLSYDLMGKTLNDIGQPVAAIEFYKKELECAKKQCEMNQDDKEENDNIWMSLVIGYENMGRSYLAQGNVDEALTYYEKALQEKEKMHEEKGSSLTLAGVMAGYDNMGRVLRAIGKSEEALVYAQKSLACAEQLHEEKGNKIREISINCNNIGDILLQLSRADEALAYYERAYEYDKQIQQKSADEEIVAALYVTSSNIGRAYAALEKRQEALEYYKNALRYAEELHEAQANETSQRNMSIGYDNMGRALSALEQMDEAISYFEKALSFAKEIYSAQETDSNLMSVVINAIDLGEALLKVENIEAALSIFEEAEEKADLLIKKKELPTYLQAAYVICNNLNMIHTTLGHKNDAYIYKLKAHTCMRKFMAKK